MSDLLDSIRFYAYHNQAMYPECEIEIHISPINRDRIIEELKGQPVIELSEKEREELKGGGMLFGFRTYVVMGLDLEGFRIVPKLRGIESKD